MKSRILCRKKSIFSFTHEPKAANCRNHLAEYLFRRRLSDLPLDNTGANLPESFLESIWQFKPEARIQFQEIGRGMSIALMAVVGVACGMSAIGVARNAQWGRRLAIAVLIVNLIGDSLNALLRHDPKTLIGLPIGGLMIWYLVSLRR